LNAILHDIDSVESVIKDLLEIARPGEVALEPAQLNDVLRHVLDRLAPQFAHRKVMVTTSLDDGLPLVRLDTSRIGRVMVNLLVNASDAMPTGGTIDVVTRTADNGTAVEVEIADDGAGMDADMLARAFDPFVSTKQDGIGLGLASVKAIVGSHGGDVTIFPRTPHGTRAVVRLPVEAAAAQVPAGAELSHG
jgi:signal transduction histidine kinase